MGSRDRGRDSDRDKDRDGGCRLAASVMGAAWRGCRLAARQKGQHEIFPGGSSATPHPDDR